MQSQQIHLFRRLDRHEVHGGPLHCLRDRLGIAVVVLVPFEERLHVLGRDQTHIVADFSQLPTDVMGARAGLRPTRISKVFAKGRTLSRSNHTSSLAPLLASTVVKFAACGLSNCGLLMSEVVRHEIFTMPVSSIPNLPAVYVIVS